MNIALEIAKGSKCVSKQVGAVIVKEGRIISTGYNGTPAGYKNCCDHWDGEYTPEHHDWSAMYEIHAELNALLFAARTGTDVSDSVIYCTFEPCGECSKNLVQSGVKKIVYLNSYEHLNGGLVNEFISDCGIEKVQLEMGGD